MFALSISVASAQSSKKNQSWGYTNPQTTNVRTYQKNNGTVVYSHKRTKRNNTNHDNYSTKGIVIFIQERAVQGQRIIRQMHIITEWENKFKQDHVEANITTPIIKQRKLTFRKDNLFYTTRDLIHTAKKRLGIFLLRSFSLRNFSQR